MGLEGILKKSTVRTCVCLLAFCLSLRAFAAATPGIQDWIDRLLNPQLSTTQRIRAAKALGQSDDPRAIEALVRALEKSGEPLRDMVIEILQKGRGAQLMAQRALEEGLSLEERVLAVRALRAMKNPVGFPTLKQLLSSPIDQLRLESAWALSMAGASSAEPELIRALNDPNKDVRYFVASALVAVKSPAAKTAMENRKKIETDAAVLHELTQGTR